MSEAIKGGLYKAVEITQISLGPRTEGTTQRQGILLPTQQQKGTQAGKLDPS